MQMKDRDEIEQILKSLSEQNVSLLVKKRPSHNVRIGSAHNINVIDKLNEVLNDKEIRMFRSACFGSFLDLPNCNFQGLIARNLTSSPQELNHLDLPNPLMFGSTDDAANVAQAVTVQQQYERTAPIEFRDEFDDFSTPPSSSIDRREPRVSLDKDKVVPNVELRDADKASAATEENLSLSKFDLDEIKSYVRNYVAQYRVHENDAGQSSKLGGNEGADEKSLKEAESSYTDKLQEDDRNSTDAEVDEPIRKERVMESKEALHNTDEDLSKVITLYVPPSRASYPTGITYIDAAAIDTCDRQVFCGNFDF
ncbi:hypothetical protein BC332_08305 [Capsicum chinense]|nr:hypothetical protein BC332_08305 [Capsicum chinense]